jgi:putative flippase GtrA
MAVLRSALGTRAGTFVRYGAGSVVALGCSELVLVGSYAVLGAGARTAAILAWLAGAIPNYILNRRWAWRRSGRAALLRETLPYWAITLGTAALAVLATGVADGWVRREVVGRGEQSILLAAVYLASYGVIFVIKFVLFDGWVFSRNTASRNTASRSAASGNTAPRDTVSP